jgi:hypothetical protein
MTIRPDNSRGRFWAKSRSEPDHWHLVDLTANNGQGECGCDNWKYRCQPKLKEGKSGPGVWCSHISAVRDSLVSGLDLKFSFRDRQIIINKVIKQWIQSEKE